MTTLENIDRTGGRDYQRIAAALDYLVRNFEEQPGLEAVAEEVGLSPYHFQRLFTSWAGISPKKFLQHLSLERAKASLAGEASVLDAAYDAGLSGPGRLHDLFVAHEAVTPGEWKRAGAGLELSYGWHPSPFGDCLIVATERGVCGLGFELAAGRAATEEDLLGPFGEARCVEAPAATGKFAEQAFAGAGGDLRVVLRGTPFQIKIWEALLRIPPGTVMSYEGLARAVAKPGAARAVAGAVARNPVSWLVPCHRIIRSTGAITGYRWGPERKRAMLALEAAEAEAAAA